ncbi:MAG: hypothetical protein ABWY11_24650 [Umezawaea sp.]
MSPSTPRPPTWRVRLPALVIAFGLLLAGCQEPTSSSSSAPLVNAGISAQPTGPAKSLCPAPGPRISKVLPSFSEAEIRTAATNPCVPFAAVVDNVMTLVPESHVQRTVFRQKVSSVIGVINFVNDLATCGYETDSLGIRVYQHPVDSYSVGIVLVLRVEVSAATEVAVCVLKRSAGLQDSPPTTTAGANPEFQPCVHIAKRDQERYVVAWAGSTLSMCTALTATI